MRILARLTVMLVAVLACTCSQRIYSVGTNNPERSAPADGSTIQILKEPTSAASAYDEALQIKLVRILRDKGYDVVEEQSSRYLLYYDYNSHAMMSRMQLQLLGGTRKGMETVRTGGPFVISLRLALVEAQPEFESTAGRAIVWEGGAVMSSATQSQKFQDLLIVAAVGQIGNTTDDAQVVRMGLNDKRAKQLRR